MGARRSRERAVAERASFDPAPKKILITTGGWQSALACVQSYGRAGHEVHLFDPDPDVPLGRSRHCRQVVRAPRENETATYRSALLQTLAAGQYDLLVPSSDAVADIVARAQNEIPERTRIAIASAEQVAMAGNKRDTGRFAEAAGILTPETFYPETRDEVVRLSERISYPCVAKRPVGTANDGVLICMSACELLAYFDAPESDGNWPIVQSFVDGDFYDATAVCDRGEVVGLFAFYCPQSYYIGGTPPYAYSVTDPAFLAAARQVLEILAWHGAVDLDFLQDEDGRYRLLEINPRFSGTVNMALKLGLDLPRAYFDVAHGQRTGDYRGRYPDGVLFRTVLNVELNWIAQRPGARLWIAFAKSFRRFRTNIYWRDLPYLRHLIGRAFRRLWRRFGQA